MTNKEGRAILEQAGITQVQMAKEVKIDRCWINQWINGSRNFDTERQIRVDKYLEKVKKFLLAN